MESTGASVSESLPCLSARFQFEEAREAVKMIFLGHEMSRARRLLPVT